MSYRVKGQVVVTESGRGLPNLLVKATDKDLFVDDFLGAATTDEDGRFQITYEKEDFMEFLGDRRPDIYLQVLDQSGRLLTTTEDLVRYDAKESEWFLIDIPEGQLSEGDDDVNEKPEKERVEFQQLLVQNANYFGTVPELKLQPVKPMQGNTRYEEMHCLGFYPERSLLEAIFDIKLPYGYGGDLCSAGSHEYVRFFVDWDGDGDFDEANEDVGLVRTNVHDIPNTKGLCRRAAKPLSYAVRLQLDPRKYGCKRPQLVKVRAILSWNAVPPAGMPNQPPVWGNVLEKWIQIEPRDYILADVIKAIDFKQLKVVPDLLDVKVPISKTIQATAVDLEAHYEDKDVPAHRYKMKQLAPLVAQLKQYPELLAQYQLEPTFAQKWELLQPLLQGKSKTKYEELNCLGLLYDQDTLAATLTVKRPYGYSGDLCHDGSHEHVAFWAYLYDQIEQQCVWRYLGTSSVNVHDIPSIPNEGLQYAVYLPADFSPYKRPCHNPVVMKIRAVLSWQTPPSTTDPFDVPTWGNALERLIQLKPEDPTIPGSQKPYLWSVGEMAVESIAGNPYTTVGSILGSGYANGPSVGGGFTAMESPFGGIAKITGTITNAPNNPAPADKLRYKVQYRKVGSGTGWHDIDNKFRIWLRIDGVPSGHLDQIAVGGYYTYHKDLIPPVLTEVQDDVLAQWNTEKAEGDGLYLLRLLLHQLGAPFVPGVPPNHVSSQIIRVKVDNTAPTAAISLDAGPCTKFQVGDVFTGKFTATDAHIWRYTLAVLPGTANPPILAPTSATYPILAAPGLVDEPFTVTTTAATTPCGYVIRLHVRDRTIRNNHFPGRLTPATVGLCLLEEEEEEAA